MWAMVVRGGELMLEEVAQPAPGRGQVLARVRACGVCGSDLHALQYAAERGLDGVVMGHEFVAEVVEAGPGAESWKPGARVVCSPSMPPEGVLPPRAGDAPRNYLLMPGTRTIGYSKGYPGGFGEYVVLSAPLLISVPDHVPDRLAATTEPCAVGLHAVRQAKVAPDEHVLVLGAGPIGLMTLLWLKRDGVCHVTVSEPSAPRRELAAKLGADLVLDPRETDVRAALAEAIGGLPAVVFECVGVPGTLQQAMDLAAIEGRVVVVGVCSAEDRIMPRVGIGKQLTLQFVAAYTTAEIGAALAAIADGSIDTSPLITRTVTLEELPEAFHALGDPQHCKVLVEFPG
ncbi:MAG TPA: zinc-binding dehydrogenase [Dehalococcoidia bacterium]